MLLTAFLAIVFCGAITILLISAVAFVQDKRFFSSAPKEAQALIKPRNMELFCDARPLGWVWAGCWLRTVGAPTPPWPLQAGGDISSFMDFCPGSNTPISLICL